MNEYTKYLLSLLEVSEWCVPIHETVVGELRRNLAQFYLHLLVYVPITGKCFAAFLVAR